MIEAGSWGWGVLYEYLVSCTALMRGEKAAARCIEQ